MISHNDIFAALKKYYNARYVNLYYANAKRYRISKANRLFDLVVKYEKTLQDETQVFSLHLEERVIPETELGKVVYRHLDEVKDITTIVELRRWVNTQLIRAIMEKGL